MSMSLKERLKDFIKSQSITIKDFERSLGMSNGYVNSISKGLGDEYMTRLIEKYPTLNIPWLLTGEGDMLIGDASITNNGTSQQTAQNVRGHVTQSVTSDLTTTITELTDIIKQSQSLVSTSQEIAITAQRQLNNTLSQLAESQNQITTLIDLINRKGK